MTNLSTESAGAKVFESTCFDPECPAENAIDGDDNTYWALTGLYPQEMIIKLGSSATLSNVRLVTSNVASITVERCDSTSPTSWEKVCSLDFPESDGQLQIESTQLDDSSATYVKLRVNSAWDDFASVHQVSIEGRAIEEQKSE